MFGARRCSQILRNADPYIRRGGFGMTANVGLWGELTAVEHKGRTCIFGHGAPCALPRRRCCANRYGEFVHAEAFARALAEEMIMSVTLGCGAELAEHGGDLAAVIGAVIGDVLEHLPAGLGLRDALRGFEFVRRGRDRASVREAMKSFMSRWTSISIRGRRVGDIGRDREGGGDRLGNAGARAFGAVHVGESVADGGEAVAEGLGELFGS